MIIISSEISNLKVYMDVRFYPMSLSNVLVPNHNANILLQEFFEINLALIMHIQGLQAVLSALLLWISN